MGISEWCGGEVSVGVATGPTQGCGHAAPVPSENRVHDDPTDGPESLAVVGEALAKLEGKCHHELSQGSRWQHVLEPIRVSEARLCRASLIAGGFGNPARVPMTIRRSLRNASTRARGASAPRPHLLSLVKDPPVPRAAEPPSRRAWARLSTCLKSAASITSTSAELLDQPAHRWPSAAPRGRSHLPVNSADPSA